MGKQPSFFGLAKQSLWVWLGGTFLFVGLIVLLIGPVLAFQELRYRRDGVSVVGTVVTRDIKTDYRPGSGGGSRSRNIHYRVRYRFTTPDGRTVEGTDLVSRGTWSALREEGPVDVQYIEGDPAANRVREGSNSLATIIPFVLGAIFTPLGGFFFLKGVRRVRRQLQLLREGPLTEGIVTAVAESNLTVNGRRQWILRYRYPDHSGEPHDGASRELSPEQASGWRVGDRGGVRFDARRPAESIWLGRE